MAAFGRAVAEGYRYLETDVHATARRRADRLPRPPAGPGHRPRGRGRRAAVERGPARQDRRHRADPADGRPARGVPGRAVQHRREGGGRRRPADRPGPLDGRRRPGLPGFVLGPPAGGAAARARSRASPPRSAPGRSSGWCERPRCDGAFRTPRRRRPGPGHLGPVPIVTPAVHRHARIAAVWRCTSGRSTTRPQMGRAARPRAWTAIMTDRPDLLKELLRGPGRLALTAVGSTPPYSARMRRARCGRPRHGATVRGCSRPGSGERTPAGCRRLSAVPAAGSGRGRLRRRHRQVLPRADGLRQVDPGAAAGLQPRPAGPARPAAHQAGPGRARPGSAPAWACRSRPIEVDRRHGSRRACPGGWARAAGRLPDRRRGAVLHLRPDRPAGARWPTTSRSTSTPSASPPISADDCSPAPRGCSSSPTRSLPLQVEVLCWCGRPGRFNGRVVDGRFWSARARPWWSPTPNSRDRRQVRYQVLCRRHHRSGELGRVRPPSRSAGASGS